MYYPGASTSDNAPRQRRRPPRLNDHEAQVENPSISPLAGSSAASSPSPRNTNNQRKTPLFMRFITKFFRSARLLFPIKQNNAWVLFFAFVLLARILFGALFRTSAQQQHTRIMHITIPNDRTNTATITKTTEPNIHALQYRPPVSLSFRYSLGTSSLHTVQKVLFGSPGPDFAKLDFETLQYAPKQYFKRMIYKDAYLWYEEERADQLEEMDSVTVEEEYEHFDELDYPKKDCHRLQWADEVHPTCNHFHEIVVLDRQASNEYLQPYHNRYLAHGFFRDAWLLEPVDTSSMDSVVLKTLRMVDDYYVDFTIVSASNIYKEALIMERMTASPRIMNLYGHCFTSMLVEYGYEISQRIARGIEYNGRGRVSQEELDREEKDGVKPRNNFTAEEKLEIALAMAEGVAELHGHPEGVIVNDDVHVDQWLIQKDGLVKFNDFNNAHILKWNSQNNTYCKWNIWIGGDYRSPEEMEGDPIDEKSDVWPMGANIFAILSGLFPYYNINGTKLIEKVIANGTKPYLDPRYKERSFIEGGLYDIMEPCFEVDPAERIDIFTVVRHLREMKEAVIKERSNGDSVPYRGDEIMSKLATRIVNAEKKKQQDRELHLQLHGNLDEFDTTATYGEYEGDDDETDEDLGAGDDEI